jgi:hypothetical protein
LLEAGPFEQDLAELWLPAPEAFFSLLFGARTAPEMAATYRALCVYQGQSLRELRQVLREEASPGEDPPQIHTQELSTEDLLDNPEAAPMLALIPPLRAARRFGLASVDAVRFSFFVEEEGAWRWLGFLPVLTPQAPTGPSLCDLLRTLRLVTRANFGPELFFLHDALALPQPGAFFADCFGETLAPRLSADYRARLDADELRELIRAVASRLGHDAPGEPALLAEGHLNPYAPELPAHEVEALRAMREPRALFSAILRDGVAFSSFVYAEKRWRWLGKLFLSPSTEDSATTIANPSPQHEESRATTTQATAKTEESPATAENTASSTRDATASSENPSPQAGESPATNASATHTTEESRATTIQATAKTEESPATNASPASSAHNTTARSESLSPHTGESRATPALSSLQHEESATTAANPSPQHEESRATTTQATAKTEESPTTNASATHTTEESRATAENTASSARDATASSEKPSPQAGESPATNASATHTTEESRATAAHAAHDTGTAHTSPKNEEPENPEALARLLRAATEDAARQDIAALTARAHALALPAPAVHLSAWVGAEGIRLAHAQASPAQIVALFRAYAQQERLRIEARFASPDTAPYVQRFWMSLAPKAPPLAQVAHHGPEGEAQVTSWVFVENSWRLLLLAPLRAWPAWRQFLRYPWPEAPDQARYPPHAEGLRAFLQELCESARRDRGLFLHLFDQLTPPELSADWLATGLGSASKVEAGQRGYQARRDELRERIQARCLLAPEPRGEHLFTIEETKIPGWYVALWQAPGESSPGAALLPLAFCEGAWRLLDNLHDPADLVSRPG